MTSRARCWRADICGAVRCSGAARPRRSQAGGRGAGARGRGAGGARAGRAPAAPAPGGAPQRHVHARARGGPARRRGQGKRGARARCGAAGGRPGGRRGRAAAPGRAAAGAGRRAARSGGRCGLRAAGCLAAGGLACPAAGVEGLPYRSGPQACRSNTHTRRRQEGGDADRAFRRDFAEAGALLPALAALFRRRAHRRAGPAAAPAGAGGKAPSRGGGGGGRDGRPRAGTPEADAPEPPLAPGDRPDGCTDAWWAALLEVRAPPCSQTWHAPRERAAFRHGTQASTRTWRRFGHAAGPGRVPAPARLRRRGRPAPQARGARLAQEADVRGAARRLAALAAGAPALQAEAATAAAADAAAADALDAFLAGRAAAAADHDVHLDLQQGQVGARAPADGGGEPACVRLPAALRAPVPAPRAW